MTGAMVAPAVQLIYAAFEDVPNAAFLSKMVLTLPALFIALGGPVAGFIADRWGRKPLLIFSLVCYGIAGASGFVLDSLFTILIGRALLGLSVAGVMTSATSLIGDFFEGERRDRFFGYQAAFMGYGAVLFSLAGGLLTDMSWRMPFLVFLGGLILAPVVMLFLNEPLWSKPESGRLKNKLPGKKLIVFICGLAFIGMVIFYMLPVQLAFYLKDRLDLGGSFVGYAMATANVVAASVAFNYQRIRSVLNHQAIFVLVFALTGTGYLMLSIAPDFLVVLAAMTVSGLGLGMLFPNISVWLISNTPPETRGKAVGVLTTFIFLGHFSSPILVQPLIVQYGRTQSYGIVGAFQLLLAVGFLISFLFFRLRENRKKKMSIA